VRGCRETQGGAGRRRKAQENGDLRAQRSSVLCCCAAWSRSIIPSVVFLSVTVTVPIAWVQNDYDDNDDYDDDEGNDKDRTTTRTSRQSRSAKLSGLCIDDYPQLPHSLINNNVYSSYHRPSPENNQAYLHSNLSSSAS
jgi:hypothetical protein